MHIPFSFGKKIHKEFYLSFTIPPRWRLEPADTSVLVGRSVSLHCQADGFPQPQIRWEKASDPSARDYRPISTSYHHQIFENGSLTIQDVTHEDAGYYLCQATNGIGPGLSSVVTLSVNESPRFETKFRTQMVKKGDDVSLTCAVSGDPPLSIIWTRDKQPLNLETEPRFQVSQTAMSDSRMKSVLRVTSVGRVDSALYTCLASNMYGQDDTNIQLIVQEQPDAPREVQISETGSRLVRLSWEPPFSGNSLITKYILHIRENGSAASMSRNISVPGTNTSADISDLRPSTGYDVYLIAENAIGASGPGRTFHFKTEEEVPDGPPTAVRAEAIGPDALRISWELPEKHLRNGNIKGFYVGYKDANSSEPYQYKTVDIASRTQKETRETTDLRGLNPYSFYSIVLQAFNLKGAGPRSDPVVAMTMEDVPSVPPQQVDCMALTSQTIKVTWQSPPASAIHGVLKGYKVFYRSVDDWHEIEDQEVLVNAPEKETLLKNLEKYTNYSISVLAFTGRGDGVLSEPIHCRTMEDVPSPPADIKALPMLPDAILLSWQPPAQPNGILQQYTLYQRTTINGRQETKKHTLSPSQHYYEALRLERSKRYEFWVTSSTSAGESEGTRVLSQTTSDTIPARIASFSQQVFTRRKSSVQLPCKAVGIPAAEKVWTFKGQAIRDRRRTKFLNNGSLLIEDVDDDDAGNYTCRVQNVYGADEIAFMLVVRAKHLDGREDYYERRGENSNTTPLMSNQPAKKSTDGTNAPIRETSMYQTCGPKASLPSGNQDPNTTGEQGHYYEDDITPYATFRLPGCESDTESSHETVREMQTFGHQQYSRRSYPDHATAHVQEQLILSQDIAQYQKIVECPTYDANFPSVRPSIGVYSEPKFRGEPGREEREEQESAAAREKRLQHKELYRRWICLIEPYWTGETIESDVDAEYERTDLVEDLLLKQEMSEAECDWDRNECY
ncbi:Down syndrome cell adhesion molecule-like protein Dscam2 [Araneus ventricosus]|uniref:Down syndrome cell adhesion molecule-like protein Dscam2 n=1 Tax=Araneus ventricosus TaxID=182803 RepID=A0A4Y2BR94_ARAVE|nr:Down syndrome cell adhesion molecule-like protein Dscam2 [Araneus ventricosus]